MSEEKREIFVGIDLHKRRWHVTVRDADVELFSGVSPADKNLSEKECKINTLSQT